MQELEEHQSYIQTTAAHLEAGTELGVEEGVEDGVDAGVGGAEPLRHGDGGVDEALLVVRHLPELWARCENLQWTFFFTSTSSYAVCKRLLSPHLDHGKYSVEGQPRAGEDDHDEHQHLDDLQLGAMHHGGDPLVVAVAREAPPKHLRSALDLHRKIVHRNRLYLQHIKPFTHCLGS